MDDVGEEYCIIFLRTMYFFSFFHSFFTYVAFFFITWSGIFFLNKTSCFVLNKN